MTNTQAPNFSPAGGIGSVWKDQSGKTWKYTSTGWVDSGTGDISTDTKNNGSFVIKPDDQGIVSALKTGGAKDSDIQMALKKRQDILATQSIDKTVATDNPDPTTATIGTKSYDPFQGKTKTEVLQDAFNHGVTSNTELDNLGKTYDMIASTDTTTTSEDMSKLPVAQQAVIKDKIKKEVSSKAMGLTDATARTSAISTMGMFDRGQQLIDLMEGGVTTGPLVAKWREGAKVFGVDIPGQRELGLTTVDQDKLMSLITLYTAQFAKSVTGTRMSDAVVARLEGALPSEKKSVQDNIEGIQTISDYLASTYGPMIGVDMSPLLPNTGNAKDPLRVLGGNSDNTNNPLGI